MPPSGDAARVAARMVERAPARVLLAIGLVAGCTLALQVLLTRLYAAVLFYHFGFLAISLALLGTGAGAIAVYVRPAWFAASTAALARACVAFALLLALVPLVLVRLDYAFADTVTPRFVAMLGLACALSAVTFLAGGIAIALAIKAYARRAGRVYAADLAGAAVGAFIAVPLMWTVPVPTLLVGLGLPAALAAWLLAEPRRPERRLALAAAVRCVAVVVLSETTAATHVKPFTRVSGRRAGVRPLDAAEPGRRLPAAGGSRPARLRVLRLDLRPGDGAAPRGAGAGLEAAPPRSPEHRLRAHRPRSRPGDRRRRRPRHPQRALVRTAAGRRDRAQRRDPQDGRRGAPALDGRALQPARGRRRPSATGARRSRPATSATTRSTSASPTP